MALNFYTTPVAPPNELGTFFATNQNIRVCPGQSNRAFEARCTFRNQGATIIAANGHFHSRGVDFTIAPVDATGSVGNIFYESTHWDDPPMARDLSVPIPPGGGIDWRCAFSAPSGSCGDPADSCCFTFGGKVESQEHCNAFVYYYPKSQDITCF